MSDSVERVCEVCNQQIPKWKSAGTTVCSVKCKFERRELRNKEAREKRKTEGRANVNLPQRSLLHHCLSNAFDPPKKFCRCKQHITDDEGNKLVSDGQAVHFITRTPVFVVGEPLLIAGRAKRTPRVPTIEKSHMERAHVDSDTRHLKGKKLEELKRMVEADQAERAAEERVRIEEYGQLSQSFIRSLIREVPTETYDRQEREQSGISILSWFEDERGSVGGDVSSVSFDHENDIEDQDEECQAEPADEKIEAEQEKEDERTAEEVLAEYREN